MFTIGGTVMQTPTPHALQVLREVAITVDDAGVIVAIENASPNGSGAAVDRSLGSRTVLVPGLVDTHIHAPQWPQLGTGLDLPLEQWLMENTFPLESRLTDPAFAAVVWPAMVATLLRHGTTTAAFYATISVETTTMLASTCAEFGQRAFVGRVAMDHPDGTPEWYRDASATAGIEASLASIEQIRALRSALVHPIVTPRFAPACTDELLHGLGELAESTGAISQTHCSESDWEHGYAAARFGVSDAHALAAFGLVADHSVLAHGDHLGDADLALLVERGAGVAHCPLSNSYFANAVFPARRALDAGVRLGLGTDVAGGSRPAVLTQCGDAVTVSQMLDDGVDARAPGGERGVPGSRISILEAFWMATVGGAELLGVPCGLLEVGRQFDAVAIEIGRPGSPLQTWEGIDDEARTFEKVVRLAGPGDITDVWVAGRHVVGEGTTFAP